MRKKAIVTGGSRGIGGCTALRLAREGYDVVITYEKEKEKAEGLLSELLGFGGKGFCLQGDLSNPLEAEALVVEGISLLGGLDALVCNAGVAHQGLLTDMTGAQWQKVMDVNLNSLFYCSKPAIQKFVAEKSGHIIVISSMWGQVGASCEVAYSAAKAGAIGYVKALAKELGPSGVRVNCVAPGVIETDMISMYTEEDKICLAEEIPLGYLGEPGEVAAVVAFLLSSGANYFTGQVLSPNGGMVV